MYLFLMAKFESLAVLGKISSDFKEFAEERAVWKRLLELRQQVPLASPRVESVKDRNNKANPKARFSAFSS
jgi:hypothetical protein